MKASSKIVFTLTILFAAHPIFSKEYYGKEGGSFSTNSHSVSGKVYAVDANKVYIKDFNYDGEAANVAFYISKLGNPSEPGILVPASGLSKKFSNEDILLELPCGSKVNEIKTLSVRRKGSKESLGDVTFPQNLQVPQKRTLHELSRVAHGVRSGSLTILDSRTVYISRLYYDGKGPDAFFLVGTGSQLPENPKPRLDQTKGWRKIYNERGNMNILKRYNGQSIKVTLPKDVTLLEYDWLAIFCIQYNHLFGSVVIPKDLNVPPSLDTSQLTKMGRRGSCSRD